MLTRPEGKTVTHVKELVGLVLLKDVEVNEMAGFQVKEMLLDLRAIAPSSTLLGSISSETIAKLPDTKAKEILLDLRDYARRDNVGVFVDEVTSMRQDLAPTSNTTLVGALVRP